MKKHLFFYCLILLAGYNGFCQDTTLKTVIFICEHGAYKSVVAAATFNKIAKEQGLNIRVIARGTVPNKEISPDALNGLKQDGYSEITAAPQKISNEELTKASYVVTFCPLPTSYKPPVSFEDWSNITSIENYPALKDSILPRIRLLIANLNKRP